MASPNPLPGPAPLGSGPLAKVIAVIGGAALLALGFVFSLVLLAVVAVAGSALLGYVWWKTRALRKRMREQAPFETPPTQGRIIEGEVIRETTDARPSDRPERPERPER